jgi:uncharacterized protein
VTGAARYPNGAETRGAAVELRAAPGKRLEGVAAVYGAPTTLPNGVVETIAPSAFAASLRSGGDVVFTVDHDMTRILGRTKSGTLTLRDTPAGLAFSVALPDTSAGRDAWELASRGDMHGASVTMRVRADRWDGNRRTVLEADLIECAAIAWQAAYPQTVVQARSRRLAAPPGARAALRRRLMVEAL